MKMFQSLLRKHGTYLCHSVIQTTMNNKLEKLNMKKFLRRSLMIAITIVIANLFLVNNILGQGSQTYNNPANNGLPANTFTAPAGVTSITVECWAGGGKGSAITTGNVGGGGGGGGGYSRKLITVVPGNNYTVNVGAGSTTTAAGGDSWFINITTVLARGGNSVANNTATGATGGAVGIGDVGGLFNGGTGGTGGNFTGAGGGGSSAGTASNGSNGGVTAGGTAPAGGGNGGNGGAATTGSNNGINGSTPGGGGGGGFRGTSGSPTGGNGANGQVKVSWCATANISYPSSTSIFCTSNNSVSPTITGVTGGSFSGTPAGLSISSSTGVINPSLSTAANYTVHYQIAAGGGCPAIDATAPVTINPLPTASATKNDVQCFNTSTGQIIVSGSVGTPAYTFSIDNGANYLSNATFNNLPVGIYKIRVKDSKGCESKSVQ